MDQFKNIRFTNATTHHISITSRDAFSGKITNVEDLIKLRRQSDSAGAASDTGV
jgi:hypothetical protein